MLELLFSLKHLHDSDLLHRDIKAANVFLGVDMSVKLGDFGMAKIAQDRNMNTSQSIF